MRNFATKLRTKKLSRSFFITKSRVTWLNMQSMSSLSRVILPTCIELRIGNLSKFYKIPILQTSNTLVLPYLDSMRGDFHSLFWLVNKASVFWISKPWCKNQLLIKSLIGLLAYRTWLQSRINLACYYIMHQLWKTKMALVKTWSTSAISTSKMIWWIG